MPPLPSHDLDDPAAVARLALACLDLTSLNDADTAADIARLCVRAQSRHGRVAAVCVWPRLAAFARRELPPDIAVAAVANFPDGSADIERAVRDTNDIVQAGGQEIDVVLPVARLVAGDASAVSGLLSAVRRACPDHLLKVILETGVLPDAGTIALAVRLSLDAGADFLKTSTGKTPVSATPEAARLMLAGIAADPRGAARIGFKASGGIRSVADAAVYLRLGRAALGDAALGPARFRIGASGLLDAIEAELDASATPRPGAAGSD